MKNTLAGLSGVHPWWAVTRTRTTSRSGWRRRSWDTQSSIPTSIAEQLTCIMERGDSTLLLALDRLWEDLVNTKLYITGGSGAEHKAPVTRIRSDGRRDFVISDPIHEGIARPWELPSKTAYNETCGQIGIFMWNWRMLQATGDPKYAEIMERTLYNGVLSGVELDGAQWAYTNMLAWDGPDHMLLNKDAHKRFDPGRGDICCPTNLLRTVASYQGYLYGVSEKALWLHHYAASELSTEIPGYGTLQLVQKTDYPWEGTVEIEITGAEKKKECAVRIRIPEWGFGTTININGESMGLYTASRYAVFHRQWKKGDRISIRMPMKVALFRANPRVEHLTGQVAVKRGPVVYCLESIDIEGDVPIESIHMPLYADWEMTRDPGVLDGAVLLHTTACEATSTAPMTGLYMEVEEIRVEPVEIALIPYFTWNNREEPKMRIWMPLFLAGCNPSATGTGGTQPVSGDKEVPLLAETPPMGWNSWNCFGTEVTEEQVKAVADYMAEHLSEYGWEYVVVDAGWYHPPTFTTPEWNDHPEPPQNMDWYGRLIPDTVKFPSARNGAGFKSLADYVHSKGLKFGIHIMRGIPWNAVKEKSPIKGTAYTADQVGMEENRCEWTHVMYSMDMSHTGGEPITGPWSNYTAPGAWITSKRMTSPAPTGRRRSMA